jgi:hypothetical protein
MSGLRGEDEKEMRGRSVKYRRKEKIWGKQYKLSSLARRGRREDPTEPGTGYL